MCGIVGYIGHPSASKTLVALLKNLEYRGYDSSGIAIKELNEIRIRNKNRVWYRMSL